MADWWQNNFFVYFVDHCFLVDNLISKQLFVREQWDIYQWGVYLSICIYVYLLDIISIYVYVMV